MIKNATKIRVTNSPLGDELGANAALYNACHFSAVCDVDGNANLILENGQQVIECLPECSDDYSRVHLLFKERSGNGQHLTSCDINILTTQLAFHQPTVTTICCLQITLSSKCCINKLQPNRFLSHIYFSRQKQTSFPLKFYQ